MGCLSDALRRVTQVTLSVLGALAVFVCTCAYLRADSPADDADQAQRLLEKWRDDPAYYAWLKQGLAQFLALPSERQDRMRTLDKAIRDEDSATSVRLLRVMERYADWLQRLPEADRQRIETATNSAERLRIIKYLREREWMERLPRATREELEKLPDDRLRTRIAELKKEQRAFRDSWQTAARHWEEINRQRPQTAQLQQLDSEIRTFVTAQLLPLLDRGEKKRLLEARGQYPLFWETLIELSDKHLVRLPGPATGPTRYSELPASVQEQLPELKTRTPPVLRGVRQKWPDYCIGVSTYARNHKVVLKPQLGPCRPSDFSPEIREFIEKTLLAVLDPDEKARLKTAEGFWPAYPKLLADVAFRHQLRVPGTALPGPSYAWDAFRKRSAMDTESLPGVRDEVLLNFMRDGLSAEERARLPTLSLADPGTRAELRRLYFQRNPGELLRIRQQDQGKRKKSAQK
jgi:hypothetical protein